MFISLWLEQLMLATSLVSSVAVFKANEIGYLTTTSTDLETENYLYVDCCGKQIKEIDMESLNKLNSVKWLEITSCLELETLEPFFDKLGENLIYLSIKDSPIESLPSFTGQLVGLVTLNLENTQLTEVPEVIRYLSRNNLKEVFLEGNPIPEENNYPDWHSEINERTRLVYLYNGYITTAN